jgi:hypothetical protein
MGKPLRIPRPVSVERLTALLGHDVHRPRRPIYPERGWDQPLRQNDHRIGPRQLPLGVEPHPPFQSDQDKEYRAETAALAAWTAAQPLPGEVFTVHDFMRQVPDRLRLREGRMNTTIGRTLGSRPDVHKLTMIRAKDADGCRGMHLYCSAADADRISALPRSAQAALARGKAPGLTRERRVGERIRRNRSA